MKGKEERKKEERRENEEGWAKMKIEKERRGRRKMRRQKNINS